MFHVKKKFHFTISTILLTFLSGCTNTPIAPPIPAKKAECMQEGIIAPSWICKPEIIDGYASLGIAQENALDVAQTIKVALQNGRIEIAKQMQRQVKEKLRNFANSQQNSSTKNMNTLYASIVNEVKPKDLQLRKKLQVWTTPSGKVYIHVIAPKSNFDADLKKAVKLSYVKHKSTWLQFNPEQITNLEKEFDVILPMEQGTEIAEEFKVEIVSNTMVGRNKKN